jgi:hypothetical protein
VRSQAKASFAGPTNGSGRRPLSSLLGGLALVALISLGAAPALAASSNPDGTEGCSGPAPSPLLPDCRAYELVSPVVKNGFAAGAAIGSIGDTNAYAIAGVDGDSVMYQTTGPMADVPRGMPWPVVSRRTAEGWTTHSLIPAPPRKTVDVLADLQFAPFPSADLSSIVFSAIGTYAPDNPETQSTSGGLYIAKSGTLDWLTRPTSPIATPTPGNVIGVGGIQPAGGTSDLSRVFFSFNGTLLPEDDPRVPNVQAFGSSASGFYVYENGRVESAGRLPDGTLDPQGATAAGSVSLLYQGISNPDDVDNQVSADGSQALFVSPDPRSSGGSIPQLYLYRHGQPSLLLSRSALTGTEAEHGVSGVAHIEGSGSGTTSFAYGSKDGSRVIFRSADQLTADAPGDQQAKAYLFKVADQSLTYLPDLNTHPIVASSADLHRFVFGDEGSLSLWNEGVVTPIWDSAATSNVYLSSGRATNDGSVFALVTNAAVSGFNNSDGYNEVYRYDVSNAHLTCVSCPPPGEHATGPAFLSSSSYSPLSQTPTGQVRPTRSMSDDAARLFFDTPTPLVASDVNGKRDVYEWTATGTHLLSSGTGTHDSFTLDNSASGDDEFFATTDALVPQDSDGNYDVYDARVGGGFAASTTTAACGSDCRDPLGGPPVLQRPASSTLSGPGNARRAGRASRACKRPTKSQRRRCKARAHKRHGSKKSSSDASRGGR